MPLCSVSVRNPSHERCPAPSRGGGGCRDGAAVPRGCSSATQGCVRTHQPKSLSQKLEKHPTEIQSSPCTPADNKIDCFPRKFCWQGHLQPHAAAGTAGWGGGERGCCTKYLKQTLPKGQEEPEQQPGTSELPQGPPELTWPGAGADFHQRSRIRRRKAGTVSWTYFVAEGQPLIKTKVPKGHTLKLLGLGKN